MTAVNHRIERHKGRVVHLFTENVTLENGVTIDIDILRHPGASAIVPITDDGQVVLIRQYRHAVGGYIWEIPAGTLDPGEAPLTCARRELIEEAGVDAKRWEAIGKIVPVPGYSDETIHLFSATELMPAQQKLDQDEILKVSRVDFDDAIRMISDGRIIDAKSICGLMMVHQGRKGKG